MSFFENIFSTKGGGEKPKVQGFSINSIDQGNVVDTKVFFKFFETNPYVASVIGRIQDDVGSHGFEIRRHKKVQPIDEWRKLLKTSIGYTPRQFVKRIVRDYEVSANAYVYTPREGNKIVGIQVLDPRYIKPIMTSQGKILGYAQRLGGTRYFTVDEIYHLRGDNDLKYECVGRSKMQSLFLDLETDNEARESNLAFFRNNQTPASVIILDPDFDLGDAEQSAKTKKELKQILESGKYTGGKNRHRASVWQGVKEILKVQDKITDMEFIETRKFTMDMVCAVYEVPKDMLGITENSNRSVGDVQSETYYFRIEEKEEVIDEFLTAIIQDIFGAEYSYVTLKDNLRTLVVRSKIAGDLYSKGLVKLNEAREIIQYEEEKEDSGSKYYHENFKKDITQSEQKGDGSNSSTDKKAQ